MWKSNFFFFFNSFLFSSEPAKDPINARNISLPKPVKLHWIIDAEVEALMSDAQKTAQALIDDTDSVLLHSAIYGSKFIKDVGK